MNLPDLSRQGKRYNPMFIWGVAFVFLLITITVSLGLFWHDLLQAMFDVNAAYWDLLWDEFIVVVSAVFVRGFLEICNILNAC